MNRKHGEHKRNKARRRSRPARPLRAGIAQHTSLHKDLDLLLAEGMLPLPALVSDPRRRSRWCASSSASKLSKSRFPPGSPPAPSSPRRPERSRPPHHSYCEPSACLGTSSLSQPSCSRRITWTRWSTSRLNTPTAERGQRGSILRAPNPVLTGAEELQRRPLERL
jgi:hypothetical protein